MLFRTGNSSPLGSVLRSGYNPRFMNTVRIEDVSFGYGAASVVRAVSLAVPPGQLLALLGPSGCGKTTLLKLVGGYLTPNAGRIVLRDRDVTYRPPEARNAGMVFQNVVGADLFGAPPVTTG